MVCPWCLQEHQWGRMKRCTLTNTLSHQSLGSVTAPRRPGREVYHSGMCLGLVALAVLVVLEVMAALVVLGLVQALACLTRQDSSHR